jgi:hypothetical protein
VSTIGLCPDKISAGVEPGSYVDVLATVKHPQHDRVIVLPVLTHVLVLGIDEQWPSGCGPSSPANLVSVAVNRKQGELLHAALSRTKDIRVIERRPTSPATECGPSLEAIRAFLADENWTGRGDQPLDGTQENKAPELVKLPIPIEEIKAGTRLTPDLIKQNFKLVDYVAPVPEKFVQNLKEYTGYYLQHDLVAEQFLPKSYLGEKPQPKPEAGGK